MSNFIQKLLTRTDAAMPHDVVYVETDYPEEKPLEPSREVFAVELLHDSVSRTLARLQRDEQTLVDEINYRMEKLRQVRVSIHAVESAFSVLDADMNRPATEPPMPQI